MKIIDKIRETNTEVAVTMTAMLVFTKLTYLVADRNAEQNFFMSFYILGIPITLFTWVIVIGRSNLVSKWYYLLARWVIPIIIILLIAPTSHDPFNFGIEHPTIAIPLALILGIRAAVFLVKSNTKIS